MGVQVDQSWYQGQARQVDSLHTLGQRSDIRRDTRNAATGDQHLPPGQEFHSGRV
jgi:hypothetical protein